MGTLKSIWNSITEVVEEILSSVLLLLPDSPFKDFTIPDDVQQLLGYVNYFVPVGAMLTIGTGWLSAIGIYYLCQTILRWTKTIK